MIMMDGGGWVNKNIGMNKLLEEFLRTQNPELIQKYIDKYLPKDQDNLERIYQELSNYQPASIQVQEDSKTVRRDLPNAKKMRYQDKNSIDNVIKRSERLLILLEDKGLRTNPEMREEGFKIYEDIYNKIHKPLKESPSNPFLKTNNFNKLQQKYNINKEYYSKCGDNFQGVDLEMIEYIKRRKKLMGKFGTKQSLGSLQEIKTNRYSSIPSRVYSQQKINPPAEMNKVIDQRRSVDNIISNMEVQQILRECQSSIFKSQRRAPQKQEHIYQEMRKNLRAKFEENHDIDDELQGNVRDSLQKNQLDRYNSDYVRLMRMKPDKCKVNKYEKDLLKNELKMRQLLNMFKK